jgi:single-strand DNA-binding protein
MYKNRITIIGNVSQEPTVRTTGNGTEVCNFSVATNHIFYRNEEKVSQSEYHACSAWYRLVPRCEHLRLGQKIEIEGRIKENKWDKKCSCGQIVQQYRYEIQVNSILYLEKKDENA